MAYYGVLLKQDFTKTGLIARYKVPETVPNAVMSLEGLECIFLVTEGCLHFCQKKEKYLTRV